MFSLKKKSATLALSTGLVLSVAACAEDDVTVDENVTQDLGQDAEPLAEIDSLTGVSTAVEVDESFLSGLESLSVTPGTVGDATLEGSTLTFPITGGQVTYYDPESGVEPFVQGEIEHEGSGLSLSAGGTTVELTDFVVDPGESVLTGTVSANGDVVAESAELFFLDGRTLEPLEVNQDTAVLQGTTVSLTEDAADLLNETFGTDALTEFFLVGEATITLALPGSEGTTSPSPSPSPSPSVSVSVSPSPTEVPATGTSPEPTETETSVEESPAADATATPSS